MSIFEAIILGIIQGATEFLPVSSSGHMVLIPALFGLSEPNLNVVAIAHLGTLLAVLIYFAADIGQIIAAVWTGLRQRDLMGTPNARLGWYIVVGTIPAVIGALLFEAQLEEMFTDPKAVAGFLLITAAFLIVGEYMRSGWNSIEKMSWLDAIIIGVFQLFALLPGVSRSGSTIVGGMVRGFNRPWAARYSFLLGIPAILGAGLLATLDLLQAPNLSAMLPALFTTFAVAGIVGYACIHLLLTWVRQRSLYPFAIYCVALSLISFILL
ncbi:MAG: undecaprenyl-diphosphatase UppP [Chloroflexi bacterium]|nr:undecaprenyl-diphosphatase UppP [Chloroflexota bacterium]